MTESELGSATWYGPTGTDDYYTSSNTTVNSVHSNDRWMQYKAYFSSPGNVTPALHDISITYFSTGIFVVSVTGGSYCLVSDNTSQWGTGWSTIPEIHVEVSQR